MKFSEAQRVVEHAKLGGRVTAGAIVERVRRHTKGATPAEYPARIVSAYCELAGELAEVATERNG